MNAAELRKSFLDYFAQRDHRIVASSAVIPHGDPTLLFTNAGMNQFKEVLLGREIRDYKRATSAQKCIRAGGKHNDLDEVGKDSRHLTFFEMLGNWSFGDYYKREAIEWGWGYVTEVLNIDPELLYAAVYKDDDESAGFWRDVIGLPPERITRFGDIENGDEENFWSMGPTGPCGPCTEIFVDQHPEAGPVVWGPGFDEDRIVEIWNLVFMEFDRDADGTLSPLPMKSVDTGMGFERALCLVQGVDNVFHTGVFRPIILKTAQLLGLAPNDPSEIYDRDDFSAFAVIADHIRTLSFSLADGGMFSNEGRGYVLRRILRRAVRFGRTLGFEGPFLFKITSTLAEHMGAAYPELRATKDQISEMIKLEEERFFRTIDRGIARFSDLAAQTKEGGSDRIDGAEAFKLYDTFGFPLDLTEIMAEEEGLAVDTVGFDEALKVQQERARAHDTRYEDDGEWLTVREGMADQTVAWETTTATAKILRVREHSQTGSWEILLDETPFYAESGGEVGDTGLIRDANNRFCFEITDTQHTPAGITHIGKLVEGTPSLQALHADVIAEVNSERRFLITCNHTGTHLLHAALHEVVSEQARQAGSLVAPDRLRFDFTFNRPLTEEEIEQLENHVNQNIQAALDVVTHVDVPREKAEAMGAMAIFGEKYGETVRIVDVPSRSAELCGGCHVENTRDIAFFRIVSETGVAAGVRRIEAITNREAFAQARDDRQLLTELAQQLKAEVPSLSKRLRSMIEAQHELHKRAETLAQRLAEAETTRIVGSAETVEDILITSARVNAANRQELLFYVDALRPKLPALATVLLGAVIDDKPALACLVTDELAKRPGFKAGELINEVAPIVGGRGGGKPSLAQAGGNDPEKLGEAISAFRQKVAARV